MAFDAEVSEEELWQMFEQILLAAEAYCTVENKVLHVRPFTKMPAERLLMTDGERHANLEAEVFSIRNSSTSAILEQLIPFMTKGATAIELMRQNAILIVEPPQNMAKVRQLIKVLDQKNKAGWSQTVISCKNVSASQIRNELMEVLPVLGFPVNVGEELIPGAIHLMSLDRIQVIVASAANDDAVAELKKWVSILDRDDTTGQEMAFIYDVENNSVQDLAGALAVLFDVDGVLLEVDMDSQNKTTKNLPRMRQDTKRGISENGKKNMPPTGPLSVFNQNVKLFADSINNRLIIRTTPRAYAMVKAILQRLDTVPKQVLLQVMIVELSMRDSVELGAELAAKTGNTVWNMNWNNLEPKQGVELTGSAVGKGFTGQYGSDDLFAALRAVAGKGSLKIVSRPHILVKNNYKSEFKVGRRVPLVSSELSDISNPSATNRNYIYEDTGIIFEVSAEITSGDLITLTVNQEVSSPETNTISDDKGAIVIKKSGMQTAMVLRDGRTLIIGGMTQENQTENLDSMPWVADIPFLNWIFGSRRESNEKSEMLVMITAKIVKEDSRLEEMVKRYQDSVETIVQFEKRRINNSKKIRQRAAENRERKVWWD